jgi:hypothetical protein
VAACVAFYLLSSRKLDARVMNGDVPSTVVPSSTTSAGFTSLAIMSVLLGVSSFGLGMLPLSILFSRVLAIILSRFSYFLNMNSLQGLQCLS